MYNIVCDIRDLDFKEALTEQATGRTGWRKMIVMSLRYGVSCGQLKSITYNLFLMVINHRILI